MHDLEFEHLHVSPDDAAVNEVAWAADNVELTTVGIDIGSSTSHLMFARVRLQRKTQALSSQFVVVERRTLWKSPIRMTPFLPDASIDAAALGHFVASCHEEAGLAPAEIDTWGIVGLLHDFDYEQNPTEDTHLHVGGRILRERGYPEEIVEAICSHADYMHIPRDTPLKKAIYACDEMVGFIGAVVKVRPSKQIADLPVESVVKKLKDKAFARSVDRSYVYGGADAVGRPLAEHVEFLIGALKPIAAEIGL